MGCDPFVTRDAAGNVTGSGFICSRGRQSRPKCSTVGHEARPSVRQCDYPVTVKGRKSSTCDRHLCAACATRWTSSHALPAPSSTEPLDLCPPHQRLASGAGVPGAVAPSMPVPPHRRPTTGAGRAEQLSLALAVGDAGEIDP